MSTAIVWVFVSASIQLCIGCVGWPGVLTNCHQKWPERLKTFKVQPDCCAPSVAAIKPGPAYLASDKMYLILWFLFAVRHELHWPWAHSQIRIVLAFKQNRK